MSCPYFARSVLLTLELEQACVCPKQFRARKTKTQTFMHMTEYHYVNYTYGMVPGERANRTLVRQKLSSLISLSKKKGCLYITNIIFERARREKTTAHFNDHFATAFRSPQEQCYLMEGWEKGKEVAILSSFITTSSKQVLLPLYIQKHD